MECFVSLDVRGKKHAVKMLKSNLRGSPKGKAPVEDVMGLLSRRQLPCRTTILRDRFWVESVKVELEESLSELEVKAQLYLPASAVAVMASLRTDVPGRERVVGKVVELEKWGKVFGVSLCDVERFNSLTDVMVDELLECMRYIAKLGD
jgi:hypothetical protein